MAVKFLILWYIISYASAIPVPSPPFETNDQIDDVQFDIPDVVAEFGYPTESVTLEAFKVRNKTATETPKWVSVGYPTLLITDINNGQLYQSAPESVRFAIKTLTDSQKDALVVSAKKKYPNQSDMINADSFVRLPLIQFSCSVTIYVNTAVYNLRGNVYDLHKNPLSLEFQLVEKDEKRAVLEERIRAMEPLFFKCEMAANGKQEKINTLKITLDQIQNLDLIDKLFGAAGTETYVARNQLQQLSQEIRSSLHIEETYEIDGGGFGEEFVLKILDMSNSRFEPVTVEKSLDALSTYGISYDKHDLSPDEIKRELSNVFEVGSAGSKEHIVLSKNGAEHLAKLHDQSGDFSASMSGFWNMFGISASAKMAQKQASDWAKATSSIDDQFRELNQMGSSSVQWERDGTKIIPKSLNLAKVSRLSMNQEMDFTRIKRKVSAAKYYRTPEVGINGPTTSNQTSESQEFKNIQELRQSIHDIQAKLEAHAGEIKKVWDQFPGDIQRLWDSINNYHPWASEEIRKLWESINNYHPWATEDIRKLWESINHHQLRASGEIQKIWDEININHININNIKMKLHYR